MIATLVLAIALQVAAPLEPGATDLDGGTTGEQACQEADGTIGVWTMDGSCVTPADYAELFSLQALTEAGVVSEVTNDEGTVTATLAHSTAHRQTFPADARQRSVALDPAAEPGYTFEVWLGQTVAHFGAVAAL
jgi:hypothetical protein